MKRLIMTMVMATVMSMTVSAQRIDNTIKEDASSQTRWQKN